MPIIDRELNKKRCERIEQLLKEGLSARQISERLGVNPRQVFRVRKKSQTKA